METSRGRATQVLTRDEPARSGLAHALLAHKIYVSFTCEEKMDAMSVGQTGFSIVTPKGKKPLH